MPSFETEAEIDIDPQEYVDECTEEERDELRNILGEATLSHTDDEEVGFAYIKGDFDVQKFFRYIGAHNVQKEFEKFMK